MKKVIYNGYLVDEDKATIHISDKGYFFDFSVYSSLKVVQGKVFFPQYHIDRLFESCKLIGLEHSFNKKQVLIWLKELLKANNTKDALLRMLLIGDPDGKGNEKLFMFEVGGLTFYPRQLYKEGAKVITYQGERRIPQSKTTDLLMSFLAYKEAQKQEALDAILVDRNGTMREGTRTNFFAIKNKTIYTASPDLVLEGITKKIILEITQVHFKIEQKGILLKDINQYDEFFITSTSMNVMPIRQINDSLIKTDFAQTKYVAQLFKEFYDKTVLKNKQI